jgi:hypothetical protein
MHCSGCSYCWDTHDVLIVPADAVIPDINSALGVGLPACCYWLQHFCTVPVFAGVSTVMTVLWLLSLLLLLLNSELAIWETSGLLDIRPKPQTIGLLDIRPKLQTIGLSDIGLTKKAVAHLCSNEQLTTYYLSSPFNNMVPLQKEWWNPFVSAGCSLRATSNKRCPLSWSRAKIFLASMSKTGVMSATGVNWRRNNTFLKRYWDEIFKG